MSPCGLSSWRWRLAAFPVSGSGLDVLTFLPQGLSSRLRLPPLLWEVDLLELALDLLVVALDDEEALEEEPLACLVLILC